MFTACAGNLGTHNIHGGFFVGRKVVQPVSVAKQMNYKGEKSGPRLKQRTSLMASLQRSAIRRVNKPLMGDS